MSAPATTTPIYDYPAHANLVRTTWFDQWTIAMAPEFNAMVAEAMKRKSMRREIVDLIHEAKKVCFVFTDLKSDNNIYELFRIAPPMTPIWNFQEKTQSLNPFCTFPGKALLPILLSG